MVALAAVLPAAGKDGVQATLVTRIPLDAVVGARLEVAWTLVYVDERGRRRPFGGGGMFVRLLSASGAPPVTALAHGKPGCYAATVRVPKGGIRAVQIGIPSWSSGPTGTQRADWLFPITNDPFPSSSPLQGHDGSTASAGSVARASFWTQAPRARIRAGGTFVAVASETKPQSTTCARSRR